MDDPPAPGVKAPRTVSITRAGFDPPSITVGVGDEVTWVNNDSVNSHALTGTAAFGIVAVGSVFRHTFRTPGTFAFTIDGDPKKAGTVVVA